MPRSSFSKGFGRSFAPSYHQGARSYQQRNAEERKKKELEELRRRQADAFSKQAQSRGVTISAEEALQAFEAGRRPESLLDDLLREKKEAGAAKVQAGQDEAMIDRGAAASDIGGPFKDLPQQDRLAAGRRVAESENPLKEQSVLRSMFDDDRKQREAPTVRKGILETLRGKGPEAAAQEAYVAGVSPPPKSVLPPKPKEPTASQVTTRLKAKIEAEFSINNKQLRMSLEPQAQAAAVQAVGPEDKYLAQEQYTLDQGKGRVAYAKDVHAATKAELERLIAEKRQEKLIELYDQMSTAGDSAGALEAIRGMIEGEREAMEKLQRELEDLESQLD